MSFFGLDRLHKLSSPEKLSTLSVKVQYPDTTTTYHQLPADMKLHDVLSTLCLQESLHVDKHSLVIVHSGREEDDPKMDKYLGFYSSKLEKIIVKYNGPPGEKMSQVVPRPRRASVMNATSSRASFRTIANSEFPVFLSSPVNEQTSSSPIASSSQLLINTTPIDPSSRSSPKRTATSNSESPILPSPERHLSRKPSEGTSGVVSTNGPRAKSRLRSISLLLFKKSNGNSGRDSSSTRSSEIQLPPCFFENSSITQPSSFTKKENESDEGFSNYSTSRDDRGLGLPTSPPLRKISDVSKSPYLNVYPESQVNARDSQSSFGSKVEINIQSATSLGSVDIQASRTNEVAAQMQDGEESLCPFPSTQSLNDNARGNPNHPRRISSTAAGQAQLLQMEKFISRRRAATSSAIPEPLPYIIKRDNAQSRPKSALIEEMSGSIQNLSIEGQSLISANVQVMIKLPEIDGQTQKPLVLHFDKEKRVEEVLFIVCSRQNLDFDAYTFAFNGDNSLQLDKTLNQLRQNGNQVDLALVKNDKSYETVGVCENNKDVMILRKIGKRQIVMAATVEKLIEKATDPGDKDNEYLDTLLLSFRSFMSPQDFFDNLVGRYNAELPQNPSPEDVEFYNRMKIPVQKRVIFVLVWWAKNHWHDFGLNSTLKTDLEDFAGSSEYTDEANELKSIIKEQSFHFEEMLNSTKSVARKGKVIDSLLLEFSIDDISSQLCMHDFELFRNIHPIEFLNQTWRKEGDSGTPTLDFFIARFDLESYWVATEVVSVKDFKKRVMVLGIFISIAKRCQEYNNFFSMFSLMAGLNLSPVQKLKKTWEALPDKSKKTFNDLEKMIDPSKNMKNFRDLLAAASPPIVPFLPIYLKDLIFMNDGNQGRLKEMINFDKLRMMANRVRDISGLVKIRYKFERIPALQNYIAKPPLEKDLKKLKEMAVDLL